MFVPSLNSTIAPGAVGSLGCAGSFGACWRARIAVEMPSPMAVESCSLIELIAVAYRVVLQGSAGPGSKETFPAIETTETLYLSGSSFTKSIAAFLAASSRVGGTSTAAIDCEASITSTTVARSRGTSIWVVGWANAAVRVIRLSSDSATATWRRHCDCLGTTTSSIEVLVNRIPRRFLRSEVNT